MNATLPADRPTTGFGATPPDAAEASSSRRSRMRQSRVLGALFLVGFLVYGTGSSLAASIVGHPHFLADVPPAQSVLALGAFLILLVTAVDVGKAVLIFPILQRHSVTTAVGYVATMIVEVVFLSIGALALFLIVPLAQHAHDPGAETIGATLVAVNAVAYQIGELTLGVGASFLCLLLLRTRLVPGWLAISGLVGYVFLAAGTVAELFGLHIGLYLTMPGFFFEVALPIWLFTKGFRAAVFAAPSAARAAI